MTDAQSIPVTAGLFHCDGEPSLLGSACAACGAHYFPRRVHCPNPACNAAALQEIRLGRRGTLYSYTIQAYRPPALFQMDQWTPYALGLVELPEGLRVMSMLTGIAPQDLKIGMPLALVLEPLFRDADGRDVLTYKFGPSARENAR